MRRDTRPSGDADVRDTIARLQPQPTPDGLDAVLVWARRALTDDKVERWQSIGADAARAADVVALAVHDLGELESIVLDTTYRYGALDRWRARQVFEQPDPDRGSWTHAKDFGWIAPMIVGPVRTYEEWDAARDAADARRRVMAAEMIADVNKANRWKLYDDDARHSLALSLGARIRGDRARDVLCPSCGRRSVWFYVSMIGHTFGGCACAHRNTCGWAGALRSLEQ